MRLIIAGSRTIPVGVSLLIVDAMMRVHGWRPEQIISGGADGPDEAGKVWAKQHDVLCRVMPAHWHVYGRGAGPERNGRMAEVGTHLLALWDGYSTGTRDMIDRAIARYGHANVKVLEVQASLQTEACRTQARIETHGRSRTKRHQAQMRMAS